MTTPDEGGNPGGSQGGSHGGSGTHTSKNKGAAPENKANLTTAINGKITADVTTITTRAVPGANGVVVDVDPTNGSFIGLIPNSGSLPSTKGSSQNSVKGSVAHSEPIGGDGEFLVDETDFSLPGLGVPFVFARHYRSGVDFQSPLGYGWNHSYDQKLVQTNTMVVVSCGLRCIDISYKAQIFIVTETLERLEFVSTGLSSDQTADTYAQVNGISRLTRLHENKNADWELDDGSGLITTFDHSSGLETAVSDHAGHALQITWDQAHSIPHILTIVDTTGRTLYFNYQPVPIPYLPSRNETGLYENASQPVSGSVTGPAFVYLQCVSLTSGCSSPLVSFTPSSIVAESQDQPGNTATGGAPIHAATLEWDLTQVRDANASNGDNPCFDQLLKNEGAALENSCVSQAAKLAAAMEKQQPTSYVYGLPPDLYHTLVEIQDADNRVVVQNTYGANPLAADFSRVNQQILGGDITTNYTYTDLSRAVIVGNQANVKGAFGPVQVCPVSGTGFGPPITAQNLLSNTFQYPYLEIAVSAPLGRNSTGYFDSQGRMLREIDANGLRTEYNFGAAGVSGILYPSGRRLCAEYNPAGTLASLTSVPAPGLLGAALVDTFTFDSANELTGVAETSGGQTYGTKKIVRDNWERVTAVGDAIDQTAIRWTCFLYDDTTEKVSNPFTRLMKDIVGIGKTPAPALGKGPISNIPVSFGKWLPPCLPRTTSQSGPVRYISLASIPSVITRPDGTNIELQKIGPAGPGEVIIDAKGSAPDQRYFLYTDYGFVKETGERHFGANDVVPGSVVQWDPDIVGLVHSMNEPDASDPTKTVQTTFTYDKSRNLIGVVNGKVTGTLSVNAFGQYTSIVVKPTGVAGATGQPRTYCFFYNPFQQLSEEISPESVATDFSYNVAGQLTDVSVGPKLPTRVPLAFRFPCASLAGSSASSSREVIAHYGYGPQEQLASLSTGGTTRTFTYDGLERLIDTFIPDHYLQQPPQTTKHPKVIGLHHSVGYRGPVKAWEAITDTYPLGGILPPFAANGIHAATEYSYDLIGRLVQVKQWQFTEGQSATQPLLPDMATTQYAYSDAHNSLQMTDTAGAISFVQADGADRPVLSILAKDTADEIRTSYAYSEAGTVVTATTSPAPTSTSSSLTTETYSPMGMLLSISEQGNSILQRELDQFGRINVEQLAGNDTRQYQFDAYDQLIGVQEQASSGVQFNAGSYSWNGDSQLLNVTDGAGHVAARLYDGSGRLQSLTTGLGSATYSYVPGTSLPSSIAGPAASIKNTYNLAGRLISMAITDAPGHTPSGTHTFQFSPLGNIVAATLNVSGQPIETVKMSYDSLGRRIAESDTLSPFAITRQYSSPLSSRTVISSTASSSVIDRTMDILRRPLSLQANGQPVAQWQYANAALATVAYAGGPTLSYTYDSSGRPAATTVKKASTGVAAVNSSYGADNLPHVSTLSVNSHPVETNLFESDYAERVIAEESLSPGMSSQPASFENGDVAARLTPAATRYTLDGAGNWQTVQGPASMTTTTDTANRYSTINGITVQNIVGGGISSFGTQQYQWSGLNQLAAATVNNQSKQWRRDALGRPTVALDGEGNSSRLIWDGDLLVGSVPSTQPQAPTLHAGFSNQETMALISPTAGTSFMYHGADDSVFALTDSSGNLSQAYSYTAYGMPHVWTSLGAPDSRTPVATNLFQGAYFDSDLGLYQMGARTYSPQLGRFLSPDPIGQLGGLNLFAFVGDRPLAESDPSGTNGRPSLSRSKGRVGSSGFRFPTAGLGNEWSQLSFTNKLLQPPEPVNPIDFTWAPGFNVTPTDVVMSKARAAQLQGSLSAIASVLGPIGKVANAIDPDGAIGNTLMATPFVAGGVVVKELEAGTLAAEAVGELGTIDQFSMLSREIGEAGKGMALSDLLATGGDVFAEELRYQALFDEGWVEGQVDLLGTRPGMLPNQLLYIEAKAGLNPSFTYVQRLWLQAPGFVPVRFFGPKAAQYLDINLIYKMKMEVFRYPFYGK